MLRPSTPFAFVADTGPTTINHFPDLNQSAGSRLVELHNCAWPRLEYSAVMTPMTKTEKMNGLGPLLSKLPTELRFMIFGDCISSGRPEFMRASQALQKDGRAILFERGVYRLRLGPGMDYKAQRPSHETCRQIQNFDITVDLRSGDPLVGVMDDLVKMLKGSRIPGKKCKILFKADCVLRVASDCDALYVLRSFWDFDELVVQIESENHGFDPSVPACAYNKWQENSKYLRIWEPLESSLGKAEVVAAEKGYCLLYRPKRYAEASKELVQA